jgi:hypothetical protein
MFAAIRGNGLPGVRRACTVVMGLLAIQVCVGMIVNLYVQVPAGDATASWMREMQTAPAYLTAHALLGVVLLGAGVVLVIRAITARNRFIIALCGAGFACLLGAFIAGEAFVKDGLSGTSLWMAVLTCGALLCYIAAQAVAAAGVAGTAMAGTAGKERDGVSAAVPAQRTGADIEAGAPRHSRRAVPRLCGDDTQRQVLVAVHGHVGGDFRLSGEFDRRYVAG